MKKKAAKSCLACHMNARQSPRILADQPAHLPYRLIPLTQGQYAKVSVHRYEELAKVKWTAIWAPNVQNYYAARQGIVGGKRVRILMHRVVLGLNYGDVREGDHIKPSETLNNMDENLRIANDIQQGCNHHKRSDNTSGYKGVSFHKHVNKWQAYIYVSRKRIHLGYFPTKEAAYSAYCAAAKMYHGEFANFG